MRQYIKTKLPDILTIDAIVTLSHRTLCEHFSPGEAHPFPELMYVDKGYDTLLLDGVFHRVEAGQCMIYGPNAFHQSAFASNATLGIVSFDGTCTPLEPLYNKVITLTGPQRTILSRILGTGVGVFCNTRRTDGYVGMEARPGTDDYTLHQLKNDLELLLIDMICTQNAVEQKNAAINHDNLNRTRFAKFRQYLLDNVTRKLTLQEISKACAMSSTALHALCRDMVAMAPIAYFISLKIERAKQMICETPLNFTQIAEALGFESVQYFSRLFKDKTGMTPSEYAKSVRRP